MSHQEVIQLANQMLAKIADLVAQTPFEAEQARLERLGRTLESKLFGIANEIEGDLRVLWERKMDPQTLRHIMKVHRELMRLYNEVKIHPREAQKVAEKVVQFTSTSPDKEVIDHLIETTSKHLQATNEDFQTGARVVHPKNLGIRKLKSLGNVLQSYLKDNPLIQLRDTVRPPAPPAQQQPTSPQGTSIIPPESFDDTLPSAGNEPITYPAVPSAKNR